MYYHSEVANAILAGKIYEAACELERQVTQTQLAVLSQAPQFSGILPGFPLGTWITAAGEAYHLWRCRAVRVEVRHEDICYDGIPVRWEGQPWFAQFRTRRLTQESAVVPCTGLAPQVLKEGGSWHALAPDLRPYPAPAVHGPVLFSYLQTLQVSPWAESGLYSRKAYEGLRDRIDHPSLRNARVSEYIRGESRFINNAISGTPLAWTGWVGRIVRFFHSWWWIFGIIGLGMAITLNSRRLAHRRGLGWHNLAAPSDAFTQYLLHDWSTGRGVTGSLKDESATPAESIPLTEARPRPCRRPI